MSKMEKSDSIFHANDDTFEKVVRKCDVPVVVDFWAPWCAPCHMVAPVIEELSREYAGKIRFVKVNVDEAQQTASFLGIRGIPTIAIFDQGKVVAQEVGAQPRSLLERMIKDVLKGQGTGRSTVSGTAPSTRRG